MVSEILLASKSPRRQQLISQLGYPTQVVTLQVGETVDASISADQVAECLSIRKAQAYPTQQLKRGQVVVAADTVVVCDGKVLGKPQSHLDAFRMLKMLSNKSHFVYTGVCVQSRNQQYSFTEATQVYFKELNDNTINYYIDNYKPFDKAGSYGIQEWIGMVGIERIVGCYYNVMGLPVSRLYEVLKKRF